MTRRATKTDDKSKELDSPKTGANHAIPETFQSAPSNRDRDTSTQNAIEDVTATKLPDANGQVDEVAPAGYGSSSWFGWFSKTVAEPEQLINATNRGTEQPKSPAAIPEMGNSGSAADAIPLIAKLPDHTEQTSGAKRSWLQMWTGDNTQKHGNDVFTATTGAPEDQLSSNGVTDGEAENSNSKNLTVEATSEMRSKASSIETAPPPKLPGDSTKSSGWVFWSRGNKQEGSIASEEPHVGEIAISDTPSQKRPKRASISLQGRPDDILREEELRSLGGHDTPPSSKTSRSATPSLRDPINQDARTSAIVAETSSLKARAADPEASRQLQNAIPNLVLPLFHDTFRIEDTPSLMQQLSRFLSYSKSSEPEHLYIVRNPPRLKSALAIGVHGYFPAPLFRSVLGQPTGTSIKFADMAAMAIRRWTKGKGYDCVVKTAALEGEGRILERVDLLWKLLLNWIDEIQKADFILVACHSQGVPVATMLVAKLIAFGCVNSARIAICAMAGVSMGPFAELKSRWIGGTAGELFEFANADSKVSKDYLTALESVLRFGVRITYIGSIDDQLVSLESSVFAPVSHPHIYRAVFVDGRAHAPNFLSHLVAFTLKLRNLGVRDHGLIHELSTPLAGSLYSGEGHSRIYEDEAVYSLAVEFALETTSINNTGLTLRPGSLLSSNPYILPFAMRGILEEHKVKKDLGKEANELLQEFDEWKPTTKMLKDVKFRLEGIRCKL